MKLNNSSITKSVNKWGRENFCIARPHLNKISAGRSMLEMLGVLAIIGVLSVGAIMGFRQAMNRHKANVILNDVSLAFEELATHETTGAISRYQVTAFTPESGHTLYAKRDANGNDSVEVTGVAQGVCEVLIQYEKTELYTQISDTAGAKLTACADNQTMVFGLGIDDSDPTPGPGPECTFDDDCADGKECKNGKCECPSIGTPNECQTTEIQNGCSVLVNKTSGKCGMNGICDKGGCLECTSQREPNADGSACVCKAKANCKTQNDSDCTCAVCEDGYRTTADGQCEEIPACGSDEQSCSSGSNNWCCPKAVLMDSVACGTNAGDCCIGSDCCALPKTWLAANAGEADLCCKVGDAAGRNPNEISSWKCCDVSASEVLVNSTGTSIATNYCCPKGSIAYDALNSKCISACPENASTTVVEGNRIGYSSCYCNTGFTWDEKTGKCAAPTTKCGDYNCPTGWTCTSGTIGSGQFCQVHLTTAATTDKLECTEEHCLSDTITSEILMLTTANNAQNIGLTEGEGLYLVVDAQYMGKTCDDINNISDQVRARCKTLYNAWKEYLSVN